LECEEFERWKYLETTDLENSKEIHLVFGVIYSASLESALDVIRLAWLPRDLFLQRCMPRMLVKGSDNESRLQWNINSFLHDAGLFQATDNLQRAAGTAARSFENLDRTDQA
jgi:hypothetical protein